MLDKLSEKGFSIPLKMWASAANIDIGMMAKDLQEDQEIRKSLGLEGEEAPSELEGDDGMQFASTRTSTKPLSSVRRSLP
jgi:hypothetical protein